MVLFIRSAVLIFQLHTLHFRTILSNNRFNIKLNARLKNLIANLFAATHIKPSSLMRNVNMLDIITGGVIKC